MAAEKTVNLPNENSPAADDSDVPLRIKIENYMSYVNKCPRTDASVLSDSLPLNNPPLIYQQLYGNLIGSVEPRNLDRIMTNIYEMNPQRLADDYEVSAEKEWWFFSLRGIKYKYDTVINLPAAVGGGYWEQVSDEDLYFANTMETGLLGYCKCHKFYKGKHPNGDETSWFMKEYRLQCRGVKVGNWVLCKIYIQQREGT